MFNGGFDLPEIRYLDRQGQPLTLMEWGVLMQDWDYKRIGFTQIGQVNVSTVWLGLDHSMPFLGETAPKIFETMIFGGVDDEYIERYGTEAEAQLGHHYWVKRERRWWKR